MCGAGWSLAIDSLSSPHSLRSDWPRSSGSHSARSRDTPAVGSVRSSSDRWISCCFSRPAAGACGLAGPRFGSRQHGNRSRHLIDSGLRAARARTIAFSPGVRRCDCRSGRGLQSIPFADSSYPVQHLVSGDLPFDIGARMVDRDCGNTRLPRIGRAVSDPLDGEPIWQRGGYGSTLDGGSAQRRELRSHLLSWPSIL